MSAITITIGSTRSISVTGRLVAGESAAITVSGATPAALYLVNSDRAVVAACETFADGVGTINLATTAIASIVSEIPAGRLFCLSALITDSDGETVGYGFVPLVSAPMPDALEELDVDWYVTATQIAAAFDSSTAYAVGDLCSYEGKIYKCTTAHPAGAWDADDFDETLLADLLGGTTTEEDPVFTAWRDGDSIAAGDDATATGEHSVAVGYASQAANDLSTAVGAGATAYGNYAASLGSGASAAAENSVQLGPGTNQDADTLQFMSHTVVDASGLIPYARMPSAVTQHVSDTTIHVTSADKTAWNAKADASDIPTVNDAALTIQRNGTTLATFTANDADAVTANITVPTATSDLVNDSGFIDSSVLPSASSDTPAMDGTASAGSSAAYARGDHVHPTDTSRAPLASPALTGTPTAPTAASGTNTTQVATTAFVQTAVSNVSIAVDSALDANSTNPVQNGVITNALAGKAAADDLRYPFAAAAESSGAITIADRTCNATTAASGTAYTVTCAASEAAYMRDAIWTLDCTALSAAPTITWSDDVTAANEDTDNLLAEAGKICVFFITEPISGRFIVARQLMEAAE